MEGPRIGIPEGINYKVDFVKVNRAFKKAGIFQKLYEPPSKADYEYLTKKRLSLLQWRLLGLYKKMLDDELCICRDECVSLGVKNTVRTAGLSFRDRMLRNEAIAERVFSTWSERLGINHLYHKTLSVGLSELAVKEWEQTFNKQLGKSELCFKLFENSSGKDVYTRFNSLLRILE